MACQISVTIMEAPFDNQKVNAGHIQEILNIFSIILRFVHLTLVKIILLSPAASEAGDFVIWSVNCE